MQVKELLDQLEERYPDRCPHMHEADREIWYYAGKRALVNNIREMLLEDNPANKDEGQNKISITLENE